MLFDMNRNDMFTLLKKLGIPYVQVTVHKDKSKRENSPIGHLSDNFEMIVNKLIVDMIVTDSKNSLYFLKHFDNSMEDFIKVVSAITTNPQPNKTLPQTLVELHEKNSEENEPHLTPISDVWLDAFNEPKNENYKATPSFAMRTLQKITRSLKISLSIKIWG